VATSLKVDEDLSEDVAMALRSAGFDAISVFKQGWKGRKDRQLWPDLQKEKRAIITGDKGFAQLAVQRPHHGVVLLRAERESRAAFLRLTQIAIDSGMLHDLVNTLLVVTESSIRVRKMD
jgi:predicted nuclease of predicted toxin-antitoxin system